MIRACRRHTYLISFLMELEKILEDKISVTICVLSHRAEAWIIAQVH